ncbi:hypothetical protein KFE25_012342 [Diacronema lutheri]|uniref:Uncharacterized protein n=1 Tax=Diacronema lutheri TaxID=2081491 RepID=A0A8J6C9X2_DIALT|nr:hypothetical protein KFE25_012342 [Diacronema lutheri]
MVATSRARKIVQSWAGSGSGVGDAQSGEVADAGEVPRARPARLGLGASSGPLKPDAAADDSAFGVASAKLKQSVGKQERREQRDRDERRDDATAVMDDHDDDDDDVGRSGAFRQRVIRAPPTGPADGAPRASATKGAQPPPAPAVKRRDAARAAVNGAPRADKRKAAQLDAPPADGAHAARGLRTGAARSGQRQPPGPAQPNAAARTGVAAPAAPSPAPVADRPREGKRSKTRSKQKNLRRDTRPEHLKPTYRTPGAPNYAPPAPPAWKGAKAAAAGTVEAA